MCNKDFVHLHCHTFYSVQDALASPEKLVLSAKAQGFSAIAITDHGKMAGHFEFAETAHKNKIKPILGCEFYLAKDRLDKSTSDENGNKKGREKLSHLTVLSQNEIGYKNILQLGYEAANPACYYYKPRIDFDYLSKHNEGLIVLSGCLASEINQALIQDRYEDAVKVAEKYKEVFGERYFIELQYHGIEEQKKILPSLIKIAKDLDIKTVASNDVHYVEAVDWKLHDVLLQMKDLRDDKSSKKSGTREAYSTHQFWLKSYEEMNKIFGHKVPESLSNTKLIEEMVEDYYQVDVPHMLPAGTVDSENEKFQTFWKSKLSHHEQKEAFLAFEAFEGLKKLGLAKNPEYVKRLKYEVETIWHMGVTDYFLIQKEMTDFMKANGIYYGIRGSGVGSLLNYCLGISHADPVKFNLLFERFLNPGRGNQYKIDFGEISLPENETYDDKKCLNDIKAKCSEFLKIPGNSKYESRISREIWILENQKMIKLMQYALDTGYKLKSNPTNFCTFCVLGFIDEMPAGDLIISKVAGLPDIDTDIDDSRRQEVIEWARQRFGEEQVKAVGTWGTYKPKAAMTGTLKTSDKFKQQFGSDLAQAVFRVTKTIPSKPGITIEEAIKMPPPFKYGYESRPEDSFAYWARKYPLETKYAEKLNGTVQFLGVHAAAIVVSSKPIHETVPIDNAKQTFVTAFDMKNVERRGIIKFDLLGLKTYRQIALAVKMIEERHGIKLDLNKLSHDDPKVYNNIFKNGHTVGIFQFSGDGMQQALKDVKASTIDDLIAVAALYRPGPMGYIKNYAKGKFNPKTISYAHPIIEKHLSSTYGIMVYQEQAMFLSREMANSDWLETEKLRKGIAKKSGEQFEQACDNFASKSLARLIPQNAVAQVLDLMKEFGGYAFNKSHSCMYAIVGYQTAYLKNYYPAEWMAACIETDKDQESSIEEYKKECARLGVKILEPNVNESGLTTTVSKDGIIYAPITSVKGVGESGSSITLNKPYDNLEDFIERSGCKKSLYTALAASGALNCLIKDEEDLDETYFIDFWIEYVEKKKKLKKQSSKSGVNNNSLSLFELKDLSKARESQNSDILSMLEDF